MTNDHHKSSGCLPSLLVVAPNGENYGQSANDTNEPYASSSRNQQQQQQQHQHTNKLAKQLAKSSTVSSKCQDEGADSRRQFMQLEWQQHRLSLLGKQIRPSRSALISTGFGGQPGGHAYRHRNSRQLLWMIRIRNFLEQPQSAFAWLYHCGL